jgi:3-methyl-2-oxobutanoate hydroxymethyltransferase
MGKTTVLTLKKQKAEGNKITMLTCYDYTMAKLMDEAGIETLLIGDSMGMTILGYEDTISVTMEDIIHHSAAVARGAKNALVIADMPFMSYQVSVEQAVMNAGRLMKEGRANMVKLEGGASVCPQIEAIVKASIPVCAHIGLTPQSVNAFGGFKVQGKSEQAARQIIQDALDIEKAGASMVVLEGIPTELARIITEKLTIPTIGIGAGDGCDGQVLVYQDLLGMYGDLKPKFVKVFADGAKFMKTAFDEYSKEVKEGSFPAPEHGYKIDSEIIDNIRKENGTRA